jgi:hypothetical protein
LLPSVTWHVRVGCFHRVDAYHLEGKDAHGIQALVGHLTPLDDHLTLIGNCHTGVRWSSNAPWLNGIQALHGHLTPYGLNGIQALDGHLTPLDDHLTPIGNCYLTWYTGVRWRSNAMPYLAVDALDGHLTALDGHLTPPLDALILAFFG